MRNPKNRQLVLDYMDEIRKNHQGWDESWQKDLIIRIRAPFYSDDQTRQKTDDLINDIRDKFGRFGLEQLDYDYSLVSFRIRNFFE